MPEPTRRAWSWVIAAASFALIVWSAVLPAARHIYTDFSNYYIPARLIARGQSTARLYEFSWFQRQMEYAGIHEALGGFNYFPPPAALPLVPLGGLEPIPAKTVWTIANLIMLVALLLVLRRLGGLPLAAGLALAALSGSGLRDNFLFGQFYIALTLLIAVALWLLLAGRSTPAGALLGFGTALKLYPAPFLVYFVAPRRTPCRSRRWAGPCTHTTSPASCPRRSRARPTHRITQRSRAGPTSCAWPSFVSRP